MIPCAILCLRFFFSLPSLKKNLLTHVLPSVGSFLLLPGPPQQVADCKVHNQTATSFTLECVAGNSGGLRQTFHLEVYNTALQMLQVNLTSVDNPPRFELANLPPNTFFELSVYAANAKGRSSSVKLIVQTLPMPSAEVGHARQGEYQISTGKLWATPTNPFGGCVCRDPFINHAGSRVSH